jgi:hypothetical protein
MTALPIWLELEDIISFEGFTFKDWRNGEIEILQPQLIALGYIDIKWEMGEEDSFGPLTRTCHASKDGERYHFIYG